MEIYDLQTKFKQKLKQNLKKTKKQLWKVKQKIETKIKLKQNFFFWPVAARDEKIMTFW